MPTSSTHLRSVSSRRRGARASLPRHRAARQRALADTLLGTQTSGLECELHGLRIDAPVATQDHTLLFSTPELDYMWETQGRGAKSVGMLEAKSRIPVDMEREPSRLSRHAREIQSVFGAFGSAEANEPLVSVIARAAAAGVNGQPLAVELGLEPSIFPMTVRSRARVAQSPQITTTSSLRAVSDIFRQGYPAVTLQRRANRPYRDAMMRDSAEEGDAVYRALVAAETDRARRSWFRKQNLALKNDGTTVRSGDKIRGFLTLLAQDMKIANTHALKHYTAKDGTRHDPTRGGKQWGKDYRGLHAKTPTVMLYAEALSARDRALLETHKGMIAKHMKALATKDTGRTARRLPMRVEREGPPMAVPTVHKYLKHLFAKPSQTAWRYPAWKRTTEAMWGATIGDNTTPPIYQFDTRRHRDGSTSQELRAAFEVRQLRGPALDQLSRVRRQFAGDGWAYLNRHPNKLLPYEPPPTKGLFARAMSGLRRLFGLSGGT